jgi:hypothetical protein
LGYGKPRRNPTYRLASRYPFVANSRWFEDVAGKHIAATAETLPPEVRDSLIRLEFIVPVSSKGQNHPLDRCLSTPFVLY